MSKVIRSISPVPLCNVGVDERLNKKDTDLKQQYINDISGF